MLGIDDINNLQSENEELKTKLTEVVAERTQLKKLFAEIYNIAESDLEYSIKVYEIKRKVKEIYPS